MKTAEKSGKRIKSTFNDLKNFNLIGDRVHYAGKGQTTFIKNTGTSFISYSPDEISVDIYGGILDVNRWKDSSGPDVDKNGLGMGKINIVGDMSVESTYNKPTFIFSRDGLFNEVSKYSYRIELQQEETGKTTFSDEYWTRLLERYVNHGDWDAGPDEFLRDFHKEYMTSKQRIKTKKSSEKNRMENEISVWPLLSLRDRRMNSPGMGTVDQMKFDESIESAMDTKIVYDNSPDKNHIAVLDSIRPFTLAVPDKINVKGKNLKMYYEDKEFLGKDDFKGLFDGSIELYTNEKFPSYKLPVSVNTSNSQFELRNSHIRRSDGISKPKNTLIKSASEIYIEDANEIDIRTDRKKMAKYLGKRAAYSPVGVVAGCLGMTLLVEAIWGVGWNSVLEAGSYIGGYDNPFVDNIVNIAKTGMNPLSYPWGMGNYLFNGAKYVNNTARNVRRMGKRVYGDGDMDIWLKGEEPEIQF